MSQGDTSAAATTTPGTSDLFCPRCGYNLRGIASDRCPECGEALDRALLAHGQIPWVHRRTIGFWRAFWRTAWMTTFHISHVVREMSGPVSLRDAQRFRLNVVSAAFIPISAAIIYGQFRYMPPNPVGMIDLPAMLSTPGAPSLDLFLPLFVGATWWPVMPLACGLFLFLATGVASYLFHPGHLPVVRQNRAIALSHYACGPLAWLVGPVVVMALIVIAAANFKEPEEFFESYGFILFGAACVLWAIGAMWWWNTARLLALATNQTFLASILKAMAILLMWAIVAILCFAVLPWMIGYIYLFADSL